jgi:toxin ParE1/3/4
VTGRYTISPRARGDLDDIWTYTERRWGLDQAEFYTRQIGRDIVTVAAQPKMGRACSDIRAGYYKYSTGSHVLFYHLIDGGIDIVRILHERMDFGRHF